MTTKFPEGESSLRDRIYRKTIAKQKDLSRQMQMALAFATFLEQKAICVSKDDLLPGWPIHYSYNANFPLKGSEDFDPFTRCHSSMDIEREIRETKEHLHIPDGSKEDETLKVFQNAVDSWLIKHWHSGHFTAGYDMLLDAGFSGLLAQEQNESFRIVTKAAMNYILRYADSYRKLSSDENHSESCCSRLGNLADVCEHIASKPPETFIQALTLTWFAHELCQCESHQSSISFGRFDYYLYPYYKKDIEVGRITRKEAKELLCEFWKKCKATTKSYQNMTLGGCDENGDSSVNELTLLCLEIAGELCYDQPSISFRYPKHMTKEAWVAVQTLIKKGMGFPAIFHDQCCVEARVKEGISPKDAWNYALTGCVELCIPGKEYTLTEMLRINLPKLLLVLLHEGKDTVSGYHFPLREPKSVDAMEQMQTFGEFLSWYLDELKHFEEMVIDCATLFDRMYMKNYPLPFLSTLMQDCILSGIDVSEGGAKYNGCGCNMCGIGTVTDSLEVIKELIFEKRLITFGQLIHALDTDFKDDSVLLATLRNRCVKFGNDIPEVDSIAVAICDSFSRTAFSHATPRGGAFRCGMYSVEDHAFMGRVTGATPDGRLAGTALSNSMAPVQGMDRSGPTALINSLNRIDYTMATNGMVLDIRFTPQFLADEKHTEALQDLIETYFSRGGMEIQVSAVSKETLIAAQKEPEKYRDLVVRVSGFSAYFTSLCKETQNEIIMRSEQESSC